MKLIRITMPNGETKVTNYEWLKLNDDSTKEEIDSAVFQYICWNISYDYEILN